MKRVFLLVLLPVLLTTLGEFILKFSLNQSDHHAFHQILSGGPDGGLIVLAVTLIVVGGLLWLVAMSKYELSFLYPFLSINYAAIVLGSQIFLGEAVSIFRYISVILIVIGLIVISRSPYSEK